MGDQKFTCGRYKNRTFKDIAESDPDFCEAVLKSPVRNKYYPEEFKSYLLSLKSSSITSISANNVTSFVSKWHEEVRAEFERIIGSPSITVTEVHPKSDGHTNSNLGVFLRFFLKKCIFNVQKTNAVNRNIELFASIFPFRVSKTVPSARVPVRQLFDEQFYASISAFMARHFEDKRDKAASYVDLFLRNIYHFQNTYFDKNALRKLRNLVVSALDSERVRFGVTFVNDDRATFVNDYLNQFPRLNQAGLARYKFLRQMYNRLCAAYELEALANQPREQLRILPEINCFELLCLLERNMYVDERAKYTDNFLKYFFFFIYAVESEKEHPVFFIDDPLYEWLKGYAEYRVSRDAPENLELCMWQMTLVYRRRQEVDRDKFGFQFNVHEQNLKNVRQYVENFENVESATVDYVELTELLALGVSVFTKDTVFQMYYRKVDKSDLVDFHADIIRALMCPADIKKAVVYNAYTGTEACLVVPSVKTEVWEFVRRYNEYDPNGPDAEEDIFALSVEGLLCTKKFTEQVDECT